MSTTPETVRRCRVRAEPAAQVAAQRLRGGASPGRGAPPSLPGPSPADPRAADGQPAASAAGGRAADVAADQGGGVDGACPKKTMS